MYVYYKNQNIISLFLRCLFYNVEAWIILTHIFVTFSENVENLSFFQLTLHHEQVNPYNIYTIYEIYHIYKIYCLEQNPCDPPGWHPPSLSPTNAPGVEWIPSGWH